MGAIESIHNDFHDDVQVWWQRPGEGPHPWKDVRFVAPHETSSERLPEGVLHEICVKYLVDPANDPTPEPKKVISWAELPTASARVQLPAFEEWARPTPKFEYTPEGPIEIEGPSPLKTLTAPEDSEELKALPAPAGAPEGPEGKALTAQGFNLVTAPSNRGDNDGDVAEPPGSPPYADFSELAASHPAPARSLGPRRSWGGIQADGTGTLEDPSYRPGGGAGGGANTVAALLNRAQTTQSAERFPHLAKEPKVIERASEGPISRKYTGTSVATHGDPDTAERFTWMPGEWVNGAPSENDEHLMYTGMINGPEGGIARFKPIEPRKPPVEPRMITAPTRPPPEPATLETVCVKVVAGISRDHRTYQVSDIISGAPLPSPAPLFVYDRTKRQVMPNPFLQTKASFSQLSVVEPPSSFVECCIVGLFALVSLILALTSLKNRRPVEPLMTKG